MTAPSTAAPLLFGATDGRELWYLTRASGIVTLALLTATVVLGVAATGGWERRNWPRFLTQGLHRNLSLLAVSFLFVHILTTVVDGYVPVGWVNSVVPFTSPYRRGWLGLGAIACDLLLALILTSLGRHWMRPGTWRSIHWLAYAAWPVALLHALGMGTDTTATVLRWAAGGCTLLVASAGAWRLAHRSRPGFLFCAAAATGIVVTMAVAAVGLAGGLATRGAVQGSAPATRSVPRPSPTTAAGPVSPHKPVPTAAPAAVPGARAPSSPQPVPASVPVPAPASVQAATTAPAAPSAATTPPAASQPSPSATSATTSTTAPPSGGCAVLFCDGGDR